MDPGAEIGHYRIDRLLGRGGMGEVYLATDLILKRPIALKILPTEISEIKTCAARFRREAIAASALSHPNICSIYEIGDAGSCMYIAMEYIEGISLMERIRSGPLEVNEAIGIASQIADALEEARKKNIVHRDIKSSNIIITPRKQVKLLDFGLAKMAVPSAELSQLSTQQRVTESGMILGTVSYMSPEQALGRAVDHRSDIFSFGVLLYEMLTGKLPFPGSTQTEVIDAVLHKEPPPISRFNDKVPDVLKQLNEKMLRKDVEERYQSVHEVWTDLRHIHAENGPVPQVSKRARLSRQLLLVAVAFVAAAIVTGLFIFQRINRTLPVSNISTISSIVALPCKVYGASDVAYLTDAVPSTLSTLLGQVNGLETKMPPTSVEVDRVNGDLDKIADVYHVHAFVVSSITADADRLTINLQLIDPSSHRVLWASQYEGTRRTYNEMTRQAADGIRKALRPASTMITSSNGLASTSEAELAFRQGLHYSYRYNSQRNPADFDPAFNSFQRALELDPKFADAAAEIAWIYGMKSEREDMPDRWIAEANTWARKALAINGRCSKAWSALFGSGIAESLEFALRGTKYGPKDSYAHSNLGYYLNGASISLALNAFQTASSLDPLYLAPPSNAATILFELGRYKEALSQCDALLALEPNYPPALSTKICILAELNRREEMTTLARKLGRLSAEGKVGLWQLQIIQYVVATSENQGAPAESLLADIRQTLNSRSDLDYWTSLNGTLLPVLIRQQKMDYAIAALNKGLAVGCTVSHDLFLQNRDYKNVRNDPRLQKHIAHSKANLIAILSQLEKAQQRGDLPQYLERPLADARAQVQQH